MGSDGTTVGIWVGDDEDVVDEFDSRFNSGEGTYSRSKEIKNAMRLAISIEETLQDAGYGDLPTREKRYLIRQAILDQARRDGLR